MKGTLKSTERAGKRERERETDRQAARVLLLFTVQVELKLEGGRLFAVLVGMYYYPDWAILMLTAEG